MNRNLDGSEITTDQLRQIARDNGVSEEKIAGVEALHNTNLIRSELETMTAPFRFSMFGRGELNLNTNNDRNQP